MSNEKKSVIGEVIFSLVDGLVLASWRGKRGSVELGRYHAVTYMMRDFLAQCAVGERLDLVTAKNG